MAVLVRIPTPLRRAVGGQRDLNIDAASVGAVIEGIEQQFPGFRERLIDEDGSMRRLINVYVNGEDIRHAQGVDTPLKAGDEVSIVPAVSGG